MRSPFCLLIIPIAYSCQSSGNEKPVPVSTADSNLTITPVTPIAVDTDDHNRGVVSEVALDSPMGPHSAADTIGQQ